MKKMGKGLELIGTWGYPGLFVGLVLEFLGMPFPGEIVLTYTGFLIWGGHLHSGAALFSSVAGSLTGTIIAYLLGRKFGRPLLDRYGKYIRLNSKRLDMAEKWFNRHSVLVLLFGRFIPGIRPVSAYSAGFAKMKILLFLPLSLAGAFLWCFTFITAGKLLGKHWERVSWMMEKYDIFLAGVAVVAITCYIFWKKFRHKRRNR